MKRSVLISLGAVLIALFVLSSTFIGPLIAGSAEDLKKGIDEKKIKTVKKAVDELALQNNEKSCNVLLNALNPEPSDVQIYWQILEGISRFTDSAAIKKITDFIVNNKAKPVGVALLGAMKNNRTASVLPLLSTLLDKGTYEIQKEALHQLGAIPAKESLEILFNFLKTLDEKNDKELIKETIGALKRITGIDRGLYPGAWLRWWDEIKNKDIGEIIKPKTIEGDNIAHVGQYRDMTGIEDIPPDKVIVIRNDRCEKNGRFDGNFDAIQNILTLLNIPYKLVGKSELEGDTFNWKDTWALVFNCNFYAEHCCCPTCKPGTSKTGIRTVGCTGCDKHDNHKTELGEKTINKIREFVETGGYLFTEDLNIKEIIERAFKKTIVSTTYLEDKVVPIMPAPAATLHPYLKYVFEAPPSKSSDAPAPDEEKKSGETISVKPGEFKIDSEWKIDNDSPNIKVIDKQRVTVLIVSPKVATKSDPEGAVAVTFGVGGEKMVMTGGGEKEKGYAGGRVLHVMSHFGKQKSKTDEFALQNLLLNFLIELNQRRPKGKK